MRTVQEISDWIEIHDIYTRYVHAVDDHDLEFLDNIFLPETTFDWTSAGGVVRTWSEAKIGDLMTGNLFTWAFHACVNIRIDFAEDHQSAVVKSKTIHPTGLDDTKGKPLFFQVQGAYTDHLTKTTQGWRIRSRVWEDSWAVGPFEKVDGMPGMIKLAGKAPRQ